MDFRTVCVFAAAMLVSSGCLHRFTADADTDSGGVTDGGAKDGSGGTAGAGGDPCGGGEKELADPATRLSCNGDIKCGENNKSCCSALCVPGGDFQMGRGDNKDKCPPDMTCGENEKDEIPKHKATVAAFYLDEFEVTVGQFHNFVEYCKRKDHRDNLVEKLKKGAGLPSKISNEEWKEKNINWKEKLESLGKMRSCNSNKKSNQPINCVSWYEAFAFCAWDGGRLPTEAEWEYAAAGGNDDRLYPWGREAPDNKRAVYWYCETSDCKTGSKQGSSPVGSLPKGEGRWKHKDLAGNMSEWVLDWYDNDCYDGENDQPRLCDNCAEIEDDDKGHVLRGGNFLSVKSFLRAASREHDEGDTRSPQYGFRCARDK